MNRVNRVLLSLSAVLVILSITRILGSPNDDAPLRIEAIAPAQVYSIAISSPEASIHLRRTAKGWMLVAPTEARADDQRVQALLSDWSGGMLADSTVDSTVDEQQEARFGLDIKHRRRLSMRDENGALLDLEIGSSVRGGSHYVRVTGSDQVFLARLPAGARLDTDPELWAIRQD